MTSSLSPRLHQIAQHVDDLGRAVAFYRDVLEFPLIATFDPPGLAFFDLGNVRLLLEASAPGAVLYLEVLDITASRARLIDRGVDFVDEPQMIFRDANGTFGPAGTEEWMTFFRDSEGNIVGLVERRSPTST